MGAAARGIPVGRMRSQTSVAVMAILLFAATVAHAENQHVDEVIPETEHRRPAVTAAVQESSKAKAKLTARDIEDEMFRPCSKHCPAGACESRADYNKEECEKCRECFEQMQDKAYNVKKELAAKEAQRTKEVKDKAAEGAVKSKLIRVSQQAAEAETKLSFDEQTKKKKKVVSETTRRAKEVHAKATEATAKANKIKKEGKTKKDEQSLKISKEVARKKAEQERFEKNEARQKKMQQAKEIKDKEEHAELRRELHEAATKASEKEGKIESKEANARLKRLRRRGWHRRLSKRLVRKHSPRRRVVKAQLKGRRPPSRMLLRLKPRPRCWLSMMPAKQNISTTSCFRKRKT